MTSLNGRAALVTGGGRDIGRAIALALGGAGAAVGVHYHASEDEAEETLAMLEKLGARGILLRGDLTREEDANDVVDRFVQATGRIDILVNNAGSAGIRSSIEECPTEVWRQAFDVNMHSAFFVTRRAIPRLRASGHGSIINNLSLSVQTGGGGGAGPYAAAKGAMQVFTRTLARELAPQVRANAIMPGVIETRHHALASSAEQMASYRKQTPMARNGQADEVAQTVLFLAGDGAGFMTGAVLDINGGRYFR